MVLNHPQVVYITIKPATLTSDTKKNHEGHEGQVTDSIGCQTFFSRCLRGRVPLFSVEINPLPPWLHRFKTKVQADLYR